MSDCAPTSPCPSALPRLFICSLEEDLGELDASNTWVLRAFEQPDWDDGQRWAFAVYWGMCSTLGIGFDIIPATPLETIYSAMCSGVRQAACESEPRTSRLTARCS